MLILPLYARYLLHLYLKNFTLTLCLFLGLVLLLSVKEIALFAALSPSYSNLFFFSIYQIPYILPLALPLSSLIASLLLAERLSSSCELTAFRASGFSLISLSAPILFIALLLTEVNFYLISEVTTSCRLNIRQMLYQKSSNNPLLLLQRGTGLHLRDYAIDIDLAEDRGYNLKLAFVRPEDDRVSLLLSPYLQFDGKHLNASELLLLTYTKKQDMQEPPSLMIQQAHTVKSEGEPIGAFLKKSKWKEETHALPLQLLLEKEGAGLEIARRLSLALFPLSFTWAGFMLFTPFKKGPKYKEAIYLICLIVSSLLLYMVGKHTKREISYLLFTLPHLSLGLIGYLYLSRTEQGLS